MFDNVNDNWMPQVCLTAYTINGYQPVKCTYISDQPLWYLDDVEIELTEYEYDNAMKMLGLIDGEPDNLDVVNIAVTEEQYNEILSMLDENPKSIEELNKLLNSISPWEE